MPLCGIDSYVHSPLSLIQIGSGGTGLGTVVWEQQFMPVLNWVFLIMSIADGIVQAIAYHCWCFSTSSCYSRDSIDL